MGGWKGKLGTRWRGSGYSSGTTLGRYVSSARISGRSLAYTKSRPHAAPNAIEHSSRNASATRSISFQPRRRSVIGGRLSMKGNSSAKSILLKTFLTLAFALWQHYLD